MARVIAVANQKGGVAKTTSTINIATVLAMEGKQVLLIDLDPQSSLTIGCGYEPGDPNNEDMWVTVEETGEKLIRSSVLLFTKQVSPAECAITINTMEDIEGLYLIPSDIELANTEEELITTDSRQYQLKLAIDQIKDYFDFIFIDCPPSLGILTKNALYAADEVVIPCEPKYYPYRGLRYMLQTIEKINNNKKDIVKHEVKVDAIVATRFRNNNEGKAYLEAFHEFGIPVLGPVPERVSTSKFEIDGIPIVYAKKGDPIARKYYEIAHQIMGEEK